MIDSWLTPYLEKFFNAPGFTFYEIPMIDSIWWRLFAKSIDKGMRMGIPTEKHQHVVTFYGKSDDYIDTLEMSDRSQAYVFLLDKQGCIQWRGKGYTTPRKVSEMMSLAHQYSQSSDE
jgi:hypothetical protein